MHKENLVLQWFLIFFAFHLMHYSHGQMLKGKKLSSMFLFPIACTLAISLQATFKLNLEPVYFFPMFNKS